MINARPRLYYNTGLRVGQVIDDPAKLDNWGYTELDIHVGLQDFFLSSFKAKVDWDTIKNADYMKYGDAYYWITPTMINENCAEIFCQLDALTSIGGPLAQEYVGGFLTRAHPLNRTSIDNILDDDAKPSNILRAIVHPITFTGGGNDDLTVIASTVKLDDPNVSLTPSVEHDAVVFSAQTGLTADSKYVVAVPKAPVAASSSIVGAFGSSFNTIGYGLYDASNATVRLNLEYIRSIGLSEAILFSYKVPKAAVSVSKSADGHIISLYGTSGPWTNGASIAVGITAGNQNLYFYKSFLTARSFAIRSRLSGDIKHFKAHEIVDLSTSGTSQTIVFSYATDPSYQGTTYCAPNYYYGATDNFTRIANAAKGLPWADTPISIGGATGSRWAWNQRALAMENDGLFGTGIQAGSTLTQTLANISDYGAKGLIRSTLGIATLLKGEKGPINMDLQDLKEAKDNMAYAQAMVQAPQLTTSPAFGLQNYLDNTFDIIELRPYDEDLLRIDAFYATYGYKQPNIPFLKAYLTSMPDWNYIEGSGIKISPTTAANYGKTIVEAAEAQLNGGCTIWHKKPTHGLNNH